IPAAEPRPWMPRTSRPCATARVGAFQSAPGGSLAVSCQERPIALPKPRIDEPIAARQQAGVAKAAIPPLRSARDRADHHTKLRRQPVLHRVEGRRLAIGADIEGLDG